MGSGKKIGEYSFKSITATSHPGPAGSVLQQVNWEGTATGFGAVFGTSTFVGGFKSGTLSWSATAYLDDGEGRLGVGRGTYESIGKHRWSTKVFVDISDGSRITAEGEIDLASRSWKGTMFEG